jgi:hypothetical protein
MDDLSSQLPQFKEYTVDFKLRQFRKVSHFPLAITFIDFDSPEGQKLMEEYEEYLLMFEP